MECPACHHANIDGARFCAKCGALVPASAEPEQDPLIGSIVGGRYRIIDILGEGGMGRVYRAEQQMGTSVRQVAVKTLLSQYAKDTQVVARFMRECGTVAELEHPNTIKVYDFGQTPSGELYIAMELLTGRSLESIIETGGALPPERVDRIVGQVCGSLQEAHDKGIIHRDLKPANIQLSTRAGEEDYVKVLDFGIAKRDERVSKSEQKLTQQGTVLGTPPYMSPEQFKGQELDARSDVYSLGVLVYEMLTGRLPFDADTPWAWATQHMTAQPFPFEAVPMGAAVPPKMKTAVMRALEKDKTRRPSSVREFFSEFTLGTLRPSMLGLAGQVPSGSYPQVQSGGGPVTGNIATASTGAMPSRPGQTQIGEPLFAQAPQAPAGRTIMDTGPNAAAVSGYMPVQGSGPMMSQGSGPMPAQGPMMPQHPPTGSGQVFPAPPQAQQKKGTGPMIAGAAVLGVIVLVGGVLLLRSKPTESGTESTIQIPSGSPSVVLPSDPVPSEIAGDPSAAPTAMPTAAKTSQTTSTGPKPTSTGAGASTGSPTGGAAGGNDADCQAAIGLASGNNVSLAVNRYRTCNGPSKAAARSAIDAAAARAVAQKGCRAKAEVDAAASIGASSAKSAYKSRGCT
ncbi:MAG TPA: protein kinase [Polyangiaceae bacterium]|nr:protein kinase [Polyangiaceae bacterium]